MKFSKNAMNRRLQDIYKKNEIKREMTLKLKGINPKSTLNMTQEIGSALSDINTNVQERTYSQDRKATMSPPVRTQRSLESISGTHMSQIFRNAD